MTLENTRTRQSIPSPRGRGQGEGERDLRLKSAVAAALCRRTTNGLLQLEIGGFAGGGVFGDPHLKFSGLDEPVAGGVEVAEFFS